MNHNLTPQTPNQAPSDVVPYKHITMHTTGEDSMVTLDPSLPIFKPETLGIETSGTDDEGNTVETKVLAYGSIGRGDDVLTFAVTHQAEGYRIHGMSPAVNGTDMMSRSSIGILEQGVTLGRAANRKTKSDAVVENGPILVRANDLWPRTRDYGSTISSGHLSFLIKDGNVVVRDNNSTNGTELYVGQESENVPRTKEGLGKVALIAASTDAEQSPYIPPWNRPDVVDLKHEGAYLKSELKYATEIRDHLQNTENSVSGRQYGDVIIQRIITDLKGKQIAPRAGLVAATYMAVGSKVGQNKVLAERLMHDFDNLLTEDQQTTLSQLMNNVEKMREDAVSEKDMVGYVNRYAATLTTHDGIPLEGMEVFLATVLATAAGADRSGKQLSHDELTQYMKTTVRRTPPTIIDPNG